MNSPKHGRKNWLLASLVLESVRDVRPSGHRPPEEEIIAWAEGLLEGNHASRVLHWVVHDPQCSRLYQSYLEFAFEPEFAEEQVASTMEAKHTGTLDSRPDITRATVSSHLSVFWNQWFPMPVALGAIATIVGLFVLIPLLVSQDAPIVPGDFARQVSDPAVNWQYLATAELTTRSPRTAAQADDHQALRFGVRTLISELGIAQHPDIRDYYYSLPVEYPLCELNNDRCEKTNRFHYELGRWAALTERICRAPLAEDERKSLLDKQASAFSGLLAHLDAESLSINGQLMSILVAQNDKACTRADRIYAWSPL